MLKVPGYFIQQVRVNQTNGYSMKIGGERDSLFLCITLYSVQWMHTAPVHGYFRMKATALTIHPAQYRVQ